MIVISMASSVIVSRALGPEGRGELVVAGILGALGTQFGNLGLHASHTYFGARDHSLLSRLTGNSVLVGCVGGAVISVAVAAVFAAWPEVARVDGILLRLVLISIPAGLTTLLLQNLLLSRQDVRGFNVAEVSARGLAFGAVIFVISTGTATPETVYATGLLGVASAGMYSLFRLRSRHAVRVEVSLPLLVRTLPYGFRAYFIALFGYLVIRVDALMVDHFLGSEAVGHYSIATLLADLLLLVPALTGAILFPRLSSMDDPHEKWRFSRTVATWIGVFTSIVAATLCLYARPLIAIVYGEAFLPAREAIVWLMPGVVLLAIETVLAQYLNSVGLPSSVVAIWAFALVANVMLNMIVIVRYGIAGAAAVSSVSYAVVLVAISFVVRRKLLEHEAPRPAIR